MKVEFRQQIPFATMRHALIVMAFCSLPQLTTAPWWFAILAFVAMSYRLLASYYHSRVLPIWFRAFVVVSVLLLLQLHYGTLFSTGFFMGTLVTFFWLKLIEAHSIRDLRVVILVSFYVIFTSLVIYSQLWILFYMVIATFGVMSLLLRLETPTVEWKSIGIRSAKLLLIALPLTLLMFFIFPRLSDPLWRVNIPPTGTTGFGESMRPGSVAALVKDESTAMRVTFMRAPPTIHNYWQGLVLNHYDGVNWTAEITNEYFITLPLLINKEAADYEIIMEPHQKIWLFYTGSPYEAWPRLKYSRGMGLIRYDAKPINQIFAYALSLRPPPYRPLNRIAKIQNLQLPAYANPRLRQWAIENFQTTQGNVEQFINRIQSYIQKEPFWYRLEPALIGNDSRQLDRFWFNTREGYCEHYAAAVTFIFRAAGIPARVILGYQGGEWNPLANYLNIKQKDAHAWLEYWQENKGWQLLDPTTFVLPSRIDETIRNQSTRNKELYANWADYRLNIPWLEHARLSIDSAKYFWERWLLFFNQERQQKLLESLGLGSWMFNDLLRTWIALILLILFLGGVWYHWRRKREVDPLLREYRKLQQELNRLHIRTVPPATLSSQWRELQQKYPSTSNYVNAFLTKYETLRLQTKRAVQNKVETKILFKDFRKKLKKVR